jgi:pyruvate carboxylase
MVGNNLTPEEVVQGKRELSFPESVVEFFEGRLGPPPGGFPEKLRARVLRGRQGIEGRPGASLQPADFAKAKQTLEKQVGRTVNDRELVSYLLYPRVFPDLVAHQGKYSDTSVLPTPVFFHGMERGEEAAIDIERGKTLIVKFLTVGEPHADGTRTLFFELNGQPREAVVLDRSLADLEHKRMAEAGNADQVGSPMPGLVVRVLVSVGDSVAAGQKLFTLEAMKMETTVYAGRDGMVSEVLVTPGKQVEASELLLCYKEQK